MTTGRINQVTTFHLHTSRGTWSKRPLLMVSNHFRSREFIINGWKIQLQPRNAFHSVLTKSEPTNETPCSPISQISDTLLPVETTRIMAFRENYTQPAGHPKDIPSTVMADPQVVMCNRFSYQQVIHILPSLRAPSGYSTLIGEDRLTPSKCQAQIYPKSVHPVRQVHLWLGPREASHPSKTLEAY